MKNNGDTDVSVTTKISPGFDVTICGGMELSEHTETFIKKQLMKLDIESGKL